MVMLLYKLQKMKLLSPLNTGEGNIDARIMSIALSPGVNEDLINRMFVGPYGQVLNNLLFAIGIERELALMTNLVKCMLPDSSIGR